MNIILLIISIIPVIVLAYYVYRKDKNKEPIGLLLKLFLLGVLSCVLTFLISISMSLYIPLLSKEISSMSFIEVFIYTFIFIAFIEEGLKWIITYVFGYNNKEFDEIYDVIVYAVFVSLGFATVENILYVFTEGNISIGIYRGLLSIPSHVCNAIFMGYYLSMTKFYDIRNQKKKKINNKVKSILIPTILHGIYDLCCFSNSYVFIIIFFVFIINLYVYSIKKLKEISMMQRSIIDNNSKSG